MKNIRTLLLFLMYVPYIFSQTTELAKNLYLSGDYKAAMPAYEKAVASAPSNAGYNFIYGMCLLKSGSPERAEKYLKYAVSKNVKGSKYNLALSYYRQYKFTEAADLLKGYLKALSAMKNPAKEVSEANSLMMECEQAERMLKRCEDVQIIDSIRLSKRNFLQAYVLTQESGSFQTGKNTTVFENQFRDKRYYARADSAERYRLYSQNNIHGAWTDESPLNIPEDSTDVGDDNYPFVLTDGVTVYFASKGRHSIGGYDLFVTRYNNDNDAFLQPAQLGMPFNSIYNDYLYAVDDLHNIGYFATDRFQDKDSVVVYMFIPNAEKKFISDTTETSYLCRRAMIKSIRDSWQGGKDYKTDIEAFLSDIEKEKKKTKRDFRFVINDNIIYYKLSDFGDDTAKQLFIKSEMLEKQIADMETNLDSMRRKYAYGNNRVKESLTDSIRSDEQKLGALTETYGDTLKQARNSEIRYLNAKR